MLQEHLFCHKFLYFWQSVFTHRTAPPFLKLWLSASHCHIDFFDAVILKTGSHELWFNWDYGLDFLFFRWNEKKIECTKKKKKNGRKTAIKFSESARFLPVGRARSNKHLFIFGQKDLIEFPPKPACLGKTRLLVIITRLWAMVQIQGVVKFPMTAFNRFPIVPFSNMQLMTWPI